MDKKETDAETKEYIFLFIYHISNSRTAIAFKKRGVKKTFIECEDREGRRGEERNGAERRGQGEGGRTGLRKMEWNGTEWNGIKCNRDVKKGRGR